MKRIFLLLTLTCAMPLMAVLPPLAQSLRELRTLTSGEELYNILGSAEIIETITKTDYGYLITSQNKQVEAHIKYLVPVKGRVGPIAFEFTFVDTSAE